MYVSWAKPYLKAVKKLQDSEKLLNKPDLVTSFETSVMEVVLDAFPKEEGVGFGDLKPVARLTFEQTTSPGEVYQRNYQRGFVHRGRVRIVLEGWVYKVSAYAEERAKSDDDLISFLARNVDESIESMKEDLVKVMNNDYDALWAKKGGEEKKKVKTVGQRYSSTIRELFPFINVFMPVKDEKKEKKPKTSFLKGFDPKFKAEESAKVNNALKTFKIPLGQDREDADCASKLYPLYKVFKAVNGLMGPP